MSRLPNPFLGGRDLQPPPPGLTPPGPAFLLMTRPPSGPNTLGWRGGKGGAAFTPTRRPTPSPADSFIPFSSGGSGGPEGGRWGRGGRGQSSPRLYSPYHASPRGGAGSPGHHQGLPFTPSRPPGGGGGRHGRFPFNGSGRGRRDRGPISDIPVDKFVSASMVMNPWAEFDVPVAAPAPDPLRRTPTLPLLDDSEIVIDSDTSASVVVENSYEGGGVSGTEGDSSPVPDTGSDSPYVATSSTSDKDGASDSTGDD